MPAGGHRLRGRVRLQGARVALPQLQQPEAGADAHAGGADGARAAGVQPQPAGAAAVRLKPHRRQGLVPSALRRLRLALHRHQRQVPAGEPAAADRSPEPALLLQLLAAVLPVPARVRGPEHGVWQLLLLTFVAYALLPVRTLLALLFGVLVSLAHAIVTATSVTAKTQRLWRAVSSALDEQSLMRDTHVTLEHRSSHKQHRCICSNRQQYIVWVKIIHLYFMPKNIMILRSCSMKIFSKRPTVNISKLNY